MPSIKVTKLPLYAEFTPEETSHEPDPLWTEKNQIFDRWCLAFGSVVVFAAIAIFGHLWGVFESPNQQLISENQTLKARLDGSEQVIAEVQQAVCKK